MNKLEWYYIIENYFTHNGEAAFCYNTRYKIQDTRYINVMFIPGITAR